MARKRSTPLLDRNNRAFWTGGSEGKLNIMRCDDCAAFIYPPIEICRQCLSENVTPHAVAGTGVVDTYSINYQAWAKDIAVPLVIVRVKLDGAPGVYLTTNIINCPVDTVDIGDEVRVVFEEQYGIFFPLFQKTA
jgi:uncharacterized OB-fold protein